MKRINARTLKNYLPLDARQIHEQGAVCYLMGTLSASEDGVALLRDAAVSYEDVRGRVHANLFPEIRCFTAGIERAVPGAHVQIVAELSDTAPGVPYSGMLYDVLHPAFEDDPASAIDYRLALAASV